MASPYETEWMYNFESFANAQGYAHPHSSGMPTMTGFADVQGSAAPYMYTPQMSANHAMPYPAMSTPQSMPTPTSALPSLAHQMPPHASGMSAMSMNTRAAPAQAYQAQPSAMEQQSRPQQVGATGFWHHWLSKNERLRAAAETIVRLKQSGAAVRLEEFRAFLDVILQEKLGFEVASHVGSYMLSHGIMPNSHFFSIYCLIFSRDPSLEGYEKVSQMFQYVRPLNSHTFASLIRCHGALHDSISAVRVLKHFREIVHTLSANDLKYRFTVYQAAHDVLLNTQWSHLINQWIMEDKVDGVDGGRKPPPPEISLPKIYMSDERPAVSTSEAANGGATLHLEGSLYASSPYDPVLTAKIFSATDSTKTDTPTDQEARQHENNGAGNNNVQGSGNGSKVFPSTSGIMNNKNVSGSTVFFGHGKKDTTQENDSSLANRTNASMLSNKPGSTKRPVAPAGVF